MTVIFVKSPMRESHHETVSLRISRTGSPLEQIQTLLELKTGIPGHTYDLLLPGKTILNKESIEFLSTNNLSSGVLLEMKLLPPWDYLQKVAITKQRFDYSFLFNKKNRKWPEEEAVTFFVLFVGCFHGNIQLVKHLCKNVDPLCQTPNGCTPLHAAVSQDHVAVVNLLLTHDWSPHQKNSLGDSPLDVAVSNEARASHKAMKLNLQAQSKARAMGDYPVMKHPNEEILTPRELTNMKTIQDRERNAKLDRQSSPTFSTPPQQPAAAFDEEDERVELYFKASEKCYSETSSIYHMKCFAKTPFVALRHVPVNRKRLVTVEHVTLSTPERPRTSASTCSERSWIQMTRPISVLSNKHEYPTYYQTKYHKDLNRAESEFEYHVRPPNAGHRYRSWKTWLRDAYQVKNRKMAASNSKRQRTNEVAFEKWLRKKDEQMNVISNNLTEDNEDSTIRKKKNEAAYNNWLEEKKDYLTDLKTQKKRLQFDLQHHHSDPKDLGLKTNVFKLGY